MRNEPIAATTIKVDAPSRFSLSSDSAAKNTSWQDRTTAAIANPWERSKSGSTARGKQRELDEDRHAEKHARDDEEFPEMCFKHTLFRLLVIFMTDVDVTTPVAMFTLVL